MYMQEPDDIPWRPKYGDSRHQDKNTDVLDGNLTVHLIMRCYQKYGMVLCSFPSSLHNVHVYNKCEMQASVYFYMRFRI